MSEKKASYTIRRFHDPIDDVLDRPIAFNPAFKKITGSTVAALMLSQAWYWSKRTSDEDGWFYKTIAEWEDETGLTRSEQETARKHLKDIMEVDLRGVPATLYYRLDKVKIASLLGIQFAETPQTSLPQPYKQDSGNPANINRTEITAENTSVPLSIENAIYAGLPVNEEMTEKANRRSKAPRQFENALGFSKPLPWWNGKEWTAFGEWVCERYEEDILAFGKYNIWRNTQYTKGGMSNNRIRGFVTEFYDSWDMFTMANKPEEKIEYTRML